MNALAAAARIVGALLSMLHNVRRVKCRNHYPEPMHWPPTCLTCWQPM